MKRRLPKGVKREYAVLGVRDGMTRKTVDELMKLWTSKEKRRTHRRERREGKKETRQ